MWPRPDVFLFGLTGGVASGKSTVGRFLRERQVTVIDADELARRAVLPGTRGLREIAAAFGASVLTADGCLDRHALGQWVFSDVSARTRLNALVHPRVAELLQAELAALPASGETKSLVCYEVPLLFENGLDAWLRPTLLVACDETLQVSRAMERNGWSREHAEARVRAQMPLDEKRRRADFVIDNSGDLDALVEATLAALAWVVGVMRAGPQGAGGS